MASAPFPRMLSVRQVFPVSPPVDIRPTLLRQLMEVPLRPGARIAVAVGSRGISHLLAIVVTVLDQIKAAGARPFIVPAMGSHGGATPTGQLEMLAEYGIIEEWLQVPIHAAMEVDRIGATADGRDVYFSREALKADGLILINRVKPHTDFDSDTLGSGLLKMLVVGLGKQVGAAQFHALANRVGEEQFIRTAARVILQRAPVLAGVAIVENQRQEVAQLAVLPAEEFERREAELLAIAKGLTARLPFDEIDLLIVDRFGKNISGTGMDPKVIGRQVHGYSAQLNQSPPPKPFVRRLFVRDLTPESHGNANGVGLADFTTTRVARAFDAAKTYANVLTALSLQNAKLPIHFETDRAVITQALRTLLLPDVQQARVVRILDTSALEYLEVSEAFVSQIEQLTGVEMTGLPRDLAFDPEGNLRPLGM